MYCRILDSLYLRTGGIVPCDDDYGQSRILGVFSEEKQFDVQKLFENENYKHIVNSFAKGILPWSECTRCALLQNIPYDNGIYRKEIREIQIEPSLDCKLLCPECSRIGWIKQEYKKFLDSKIFEKLLQNLKSREYKVNLISFCGQGEPLNNNEFSLFVDMAKYYYNDSFCQLTTNGNHSYVDTINKSYLDEIIVSCDGSNQNSYEKYRINGNFNKVIQFMLDSKTCSPKTKIIWKYILFNHNDGYSEVIEAQRLASKCCVDELWFILTPSKNMSKNYDIENIDKFPLITDKAFIKCHPMLTRVDVLGIPVTLQDSRMLPGEKYRINYCVVDQFYLTNRDKGLLCTISGWCLNKNSIKIEKVIICIDDIIYNNVSFNLNRPDVAKCYPMPYAINSGFLLNKYLNITSENVIITVKAILNNGNYEEHSVLFNLRNVL